ncbi:hypothetical protein HYR99_18495 [Candidatus Poribacteria bacterium]|nr:hypothetical protein [Candidatus Poribacteria bacterium]
MSYKQAFTLSISILSILFIIPNLALATDWYKIVTLGKDLIVACVSVVIGVLGYSVWKKQFIGKEKYELARRVLILIYKIKESIAAVRNPITSVSFDNLVEDLSQSRADQVEAEAEKYGKRWTEILSPPVSELNAVGLEVEAVLGLETRKKINLLEKCVKELYLSVADYFMGSDNLARYREDDEQAIEGRQKFRKVIYSTSRDDKFAAQVDESIKEIESNFRPYLKL